METTEPQSRSRKAQAETVSTGAKGDGSHRSLPKEDTKTPTLAELTARCRALEQQLVMQEEKLQAYSQLRVLIARRGIHTIVLAIVTCDKDGMQLANRITAKLEAMNLPWSVDWLLSDFVTPNVFARIDLDALTAD